MQAWIYLGIAIIAEVIGRLYQAHSFHIDLCLLRHCLHPINNEPKENRGKCRLCSLVRFGHSTHRYHRYRLLQGTGNAAQTGQHRANHSWSGRPQYGRDKTLVIV